jgi:putative flippase GtrA
MSPNVHDLNSSRSVWQIATSGQRELVRFLLTGLLNTAFGYGVFAACWALTTDTVYAIITSNIVGALFNFYTIRRFVFRCGNPNKTIVAFLAVYAFVLVINLLGAQVMSGLNVHPILGQAMLLPILVGTSFVLNKYLVFRRSR